MSRALPLFVVAVALAAPARAQEMIEIPNAPPPPCCVVEEPPPPAPASSLYLAVDAGLGYRRAFDADFLGGTVTVSLGGQTARFAIVARLRLDAGAVDGLIAYQHPMFGPEILFRIAPRVTLGFGTSFGVLVYERASAARLTDPVVWAPSFGADLATTVDLVRTRRGGALFAHARLGFDWIEPAGSDSGFSFTVGAGLGYRY